MTRDEVERLHRENEASVFPDKGKRALLATLLELMSASASTPEAAAPGPEVEALVDAFREAAQAWQEVPIGPDDDESRCPEWHTYRAARLALLSAIASSVAAAREEGRREGIEEARSAVETTEPAFAYGIPDAHDTLIRAAEAVRALSSESKGDDRG